MPVSPDELLLRLGVHTPLYAADERSIFAALNDKDGGVFFAVDRESGNFRWRVENASGWAVASPLIWEDLFIIGTSTAEMRSRREEGAALATVDWKRGGALYSFEAADGKVRFWDERTGIVRETPRVEEGVLIVEGEIRTGGFREEAPWSVSARVESRFALPGGRLLGRRVRGEAPPDYFPGEPAPAGWD
ncbi:MAG: PQQ-binding-like beta-propeller repeat protein [bacterium]